MKKFHIYQVLLFLFLFLSIDKAIYYPLTWMLEHTKNDYGSINKMYYGKINADAVFFGSSRIYCHIEPIEFEKYSGLSAYNMGMDASNCFQHFFTLKEYIKFNKKPKSIIFEADMESFGTNVLRFKKEIFRPYLYKSKGVLDLFYKNPLQKIQLPVMSLAFRNRVLRVIYKYLYPPKNETKDNIFIKGSYLKKVAKWNTAKNKFPPLDIIISENRKQLYKDVVKYCSSQNIPLFFIATPRYITDKISPDNYKKIISFFTKLADKNNTTWFINLGNDNKFNSNPKYFRGNRHMNIMGTKLFSKKLGIIVKKKLAANMKLKEIYNTPAMKKIEKHEKL